MKNCNLKLLSMNGPGKSVKTPWLNIFLNFIQNEADKGRTMNTPKMCLMCVCFFAEIKIKKDIGVKIVKSYHQSPLIKKHMSETYRSWKSKKVRPDILKYLVTRNPLLSLIVEKLHCIESEEEGKEKEPTLPLERLLQSKNINSLAMFHDQNVMLATLEGLVDREKLWLWLDNAVEQNDWHACLEIMTFIPEKQFKSDPRFSELRFWILQHLSRYKGIFFNKQY